MRKQFDDFIGQEFGRLTIIGISPPAENGTGRTCFIAKCTCGTTKVIKAQGVLRGDIVSFGCRKREILRAQQEHGRKHGGKGTRLYSIWIGVRRRCYAAYDPYYHYYGGRGITVCDEWRNDFAAFRDWSLANGYRDDLTIDRIDNDKGYSPDNCRWITQADNNRHQWETRRKK